MNRVRKINEGEITIRRTPEHWSISFTMPGHAGWMVGRASLPEALRALADHLETPPSWSRPTGQA